MMVSLTPSTLTNHAFQAAETGAPTEAFGNAEPSQLFTASWKVAGFPWNARKLSMIPANADARFRANLGFAWAFDPDASAAQADKLGLPAPSLHERCLLSKLQRDLKAGEEIMEVSAQSVHLIMLIVRSDDQCTHRLRVQPFSK